MWGVGEGRRMQFYPTNKETVSRFEPVTFRSQGINIAVALRFAFKH